VSAPYTLEEALALRASHYGASAARVIATVEALNALKAEVELHRRELAGWKKSLAESYEERKSAIAERNEAREREEALRKTLEHALVNAIAVEKAREVEAPRRPAANPDLVRVRSRLGAAVLEFCRSRLGQTFHAAELHGAVPYAAPASAEYTLRELRRDGVVDYQVVSRSESLYLVRAMAS
jgi:hypothetical protein